MKTCTRCGKDKSIDSFYKRADRKSGFYPSCKECKASYEHVRYAKYYVSNGEARRAAGRAYIKLNPGKINARTNRKRAIKLQRSPKWLSKTHYSLIAMFYDRARYLTQVTGVRHHVDHIRPLQGKLECGLHVPWNLRVIPANENISKGNR